MNRLALLAALLLFSITPASAELSQADGLKAAEQWLALVDDGKSNESWERGASMLKGAIDKAGWAAAVEQARGPLGPLSSRNYSGDRRLSELAGAPPGDYLVIQYASSFENRKGLTEVVTLVDEGGQWKVAGYFVR